MKKILVVVALVFLAASIFGCAKKQAGEEMAEPMSMEALSNMTVATPVAAPEVRAQVTASVPAAVSQQELVTPSGSYKPTSIEIQTALKNADFYAGEVDGKIGPKTKKAIEEFQKSVGLQADGKVGPKTWSALSVYLSQPAEAQQTKQKR